MLESGWYDRRLGRLRPASGHPAAGRRREPVASRDVPENNPAGRLLELINAAAAEVTNNDTTTIKEAWSRALGTEDDVELFRRLAHVYALPGAVRDAAEAIPEPTLDLDLLLEPLGHIDEAFGQGLYVPWRAFISNASQARYSLGVISSMLTRTVPEASVSQKQLNDLLEDVRRLLDDIASSDLDDDLRLFLTQHAQLMQQAIEDVRIRGAAALQDVAERTIGAVLVRQHTAGAPAEGEKGKSFRDRLFGVAREMLVVISVVSGALELGDTIRALPAGPEPEEAVMEESPEETP